VCAMCKALDLEARYHKVEAPAAATHELLHFLLGMGLGWISVPALSVEAAQLQLEQPEGLQITALLSAVGTVGSSIVVPAFLALQSFAATEIDLWVRIALAAHLLATLLGASLSHATVCGASVVLYLIAFLGSLAANLQRLAAMPWVMQHGSHASVSWLLAGGNFTALVCALLGVWQHPGGEARISVGGYFGLLALVVVAAAASYILLRRRRSAAAALDLSPTSLMKRSPSSVMAEQPGGDGGGGASGGGSASLSLWPLPRFATHAEVALCTATNALVQTLCWVMIGFFVPFAANHAAGGVREGSVLLGYTAEMSTVAVFVGSVCSAYLPNAALHCWATMAAMLACFFAVAALALGAHLPAPCLLLQCVCTTARFIDGFPL